jgi:uncharacterized protein DUF805
MNFVEAISSCFRNYANFSGRAVRSEYWYWFLFVAIVLIVFGAIDESLYPGPLNMGLFSYVTMAVVLALILPSLAISRCRTKGSAACRRRKALHRLSRLFQPRCVSLRMQQSTNRQRVETDEPTRIGGARKQDRQ